MDKNINTNLNTSKKIKILLLIFIFVCLMAILFISAVQMYRENAEKKALMERTVNLWTDKSYGNKYFEGEDLRGLKRRAIYELLKNKLENNKKRKVKIRINKKQEVCNVSDLVEGFVYKCEGMENGEPTDVVQSNDIDAYLNKIVDFIIDSDKDLSLENQYDIIRGNKKSKEIRVDFTYQADKEKINKLANRLSKKYDKKPVNASINGDLKVKKEKSGRVVDTEVIIKKLNEYLSFESEKDIVIEAVTKMVDANIKKEQLKKIKYKMSSFSTSFNPSRPRGRNIALGAKRLNGTLLMPGEKISFLDILYDDSDGKSYKKSAGFWHNKVVLVEGGGICQISTTAYDACLLAGIIPEKRYPHSCPVGYSVLGLDAALSVGGKDLVIKNNRKHPFLIQAKVSGGRLKVSFYSYKNELKGYNYKIRAVKISALKAKSYLDVYKKGKKIKTIYLSTDKYNRAGR